MQLLIPGLIIMAICLVFIGLAMPLMARDAVRTRLAQFGDRPRSLEELELEAPFSERIMRPLLQRLAGYMQRMSRQKDVKVQERQANTLQQRLALAGNPNRWSPTDFLGVKALVGLSFGGTLFLLVTLLGEPLFAVLAAGVGGLGGFFAPELYLNQLIRTRQHDIRKVMPDSLDLLCICVEAGLGFDAALARLCQKSDTALTREFSRVLAELRVGRPRRDALKDVIVRTEVPDLANFISAIVQADTLGVSVTQVLAVQSDQMRVLRRQRAEEQAAQAPLKMLIPMMLFIFPALCIMILGPLWPQMAGISTTAP
ncbi:MAG: type secretion system protein [Chloroflexi bacterium]|nr:type secretion system protein [Chloroflexota bacterium]